MRQLLEDAARCAILYLEGLAERGVAPTAEALERLTALQEKLPDEPVSDSTTLALLEDIASPATVANAGGRFFGFVNGGSLPVAVAADWLATAWDQNATRYVASPAASVLEEIALRWLLDLLRLPPDAAGAFVTGATMANFTALAAARHAVLERVGWRVESDGLFGAPSITVVVGEEAHPSVFKALGLLGLGRDRVHRVPVDAQGRMRAELIPALTAPAIVCVQAGNVNTGAFDPIADVVARMHDSGAWVHVDGAFGLWAAASPALAHLLAGVDRADSWATDAHKWLNVPYDSGLAFVRDAEALRSAMAVSADYLPASAGHREPSDYTPELSRRARGVAVWAALRTLGRSGIAEMVERCCRHARRFAQALREDGIAVLNEVVLNQVLVDFGDARTTMRVVDGLQADGTCWCGPTRWQGRTAMRISVSSWATTEEDVEQSVATIRRIARASRA
ncbi:MAG TPA: aminotransferase class V-fold PLP-dependent enzyme [Burkholderiaceae bacterium]|nr:aminotransferase class V-fold PLP-dependent enzyme [Burkholderiaceae bacterium]